MIPHRTQMSSTRATSRARAIPWLLAAALGLSLAGTAHASSSSAGEEYLSTDEAAPPNVLFLLDLSSDMGEPCPTSPESYDTGSDTGSDTGTSDTGSDTGSSTTDTGSSGDPCIDEVTDAVDQITQHFDWARFGVVGTAESDSDNTYYEIAPLGSTHAEISAALSSVTNFTTDTRNLGESLSQLGSYFDNTSLDDGTDDDGDGFDADWGEAPIQYWCQENHVVVITVDRSEDDEDVASGYDASVSGDIVCDQTEITTGTDEECLYDNAAAVLYDTDYRADLDDTQNVVLHTIAIGLDKDTIAESLFGNAADQTDGEGIYTIAEDSDEVLGAILLTMTDIRAGYYSRSTPVLSSEGDYLIYSFYEIEGGDPLAEGHVRAYQVDTDPTSATYGQIEYLSGSPYDDWGGAVWDAGNLLVSRPVRKAETQPNDRDGAGKRDIYTFVDEMMATSKSIEGTDDRRMSYDRTFVTAMVGYPSVFDEFMDASTSGSCASDTTYDINDDCSVDDTDYQLLVDFIRGYPNATFRYLDETRGYWKLGDSPHSTPVVVDARNDAYTVDSTYRAFLDAQEAADVPAMVYIAANDGMLHAFFLEDLASTSHSDEGEEAWAWIPSYALYRDPPTAWSGHLLDQMLYGRTFLFDGSPVVEDVWLDDNGDGAKDEDGNEWHRVLVVQQGKGGPVTLALDVTDPEDPQYLWEQVDHRDASAQGYSVSRPVIANVYDVRDATSPQDRWVAMWGAGRAVPYTSSTSYYESTEANLYMWAIADDYWTGPSAADYVGLSTSSSSTWDYGSGVLMDEGGTNGHPEEDTFSSTLDSDGDDYYEYAYISAALAVVDADSDGDADVVYFPVTTTYGSNDSGNAPSTDVEDPGETWFWKALIDTSNPDEITWCDDAFYDPYDTVGARPAVYYAATASWLEDGTLGIYWGTGTPYERTTTDPGYFFAVQDPSPTECSEAKAISCLSYDGYYPLDNGEGLTASPIVYAGVVYFSTYVPATDSSGNVDTCEAGTGRVYGISYDDCAAGMDTDNDGDVDSSDDAYIEVDGYPSQPAVSEHGTIFVGNSNPTVDGSSAALTTIDVATDPYLGTSSMSWMEIY